MQCDCSKSSGAMKMGLFGAVGVLHKFSLNWLGPERCSRIQMCGLRRQRNRLACVLIRNKKRRGDGRRKSQHNQMNSYKDS